MKKSASSLLHEKYFVEYTQHKKQNCEICGTGSEKRDSDGFLSSKIHLTIHHIDRYVTNNDPSNLQTLCRPCHDKIHEGILPTSY